MNVHLDNLRAHSEPLVFYSRFEARSRVWQKTCMLTYIAIEFVLIYPFTCYSNSERWDEIIDGCINTAYQDGRKGETGARETPRTSTKLWTEDGAADLSILRGVTELEPLGSFQSGSPCPTPWTYSL